LRQPFHFSSSENVRVGASVSLSHPSGRLFSWLPLTPLLS